MCGVVGLLIRDPSFEPQLGSMLVSMIGALDERGPDSSGIAVYADDQRRGPTGTSLPRPLKISLGSDAPVDWQHVGETLSLRLGAAIGLQPFGAGMVVEASESVEDELLLTIATSFPQVRVLGTGRTLRVLKDTGRPTETCARYGVAGWDGYLAVAHTRMATESAVTVLHSHPFVPTRDLCVVHNGSFSNYATVRRFLMANGVRFDSDNDSEVAARYLAHRLGLGDDLEEGYSPGGAAGAGGAGGDASAVVAETEGYVAVASEYRALAELPGIATATVFEPQPEEVYTWSR